MLQAGYQIVLRSSVMAQCVVVLNRDTDWPEHASWSIFQSNKGQQFLLCMWLSAQTSCVCLSGQDRDLVWSDFIV